MAFRRGEISARDRAQELMYQAMESGSAEEAEALCRRALKIYPDCVDALAMLAEMKPSRVADFVEEMRAVVAAGRRDLGAKFFKQNKGMFWLMVETRPLMRAMGVLVAELLGWGIPERVDEAIGLQEEMLELNPNDHQGMRYLLLGSYLQRKRYEAAEELLERYKGDGSAVFAWARVLLAFVNGGEEAAVGALREAKAVNGHVLPYWTGAKRLPRRMPEFYERGKESEAIVCADALKGAWRAHPKVKAWVKGVAGK